MPSEEAMHRCDAVLIIGSTMPWVDSYPQPGAARGVQIDLKADRIGLRFPVEVGLVGDSKETLRALLPLLRQKDDAFLRQIQASVTQWNALLDRVAATERKPMRPQSVIRAVSDTLAPEAIVCLDCSANTHFAARFLTLRHGATTGRHRHACDHGARAALRDRGPTGKPWFILRFLSELIATCMSSYASHESRFFRLQGAQGWVEMDPAFGYNGLRMRHGTLIDGKSATTEVQIDPQNQFAREIDHMSVCVKDDIVPHTPGEEGLQDQRIIEAIYESARTGRAVKLAQPGMPTRGPDPQEEAF